jgi:hypothetical protein
VLMEWLTTEGNYADYCGATGNKGKSKTQYHKELSLLIKEKQPDSERTDKDVENKITSLERQFRVASDWANNTGQGVDNPGDFEAAIIKRCPFYKELEPIMGDRPNAKPLASNEDSDEEESMPPLTAAPTALSHSLQDDSPDNNTPPKNKTCSSVSSIASSRSTGSSKRRMKTANQPNKKKGKGRNVDEVLSSYLGMDQEEDDAEVNNTSFRGLRLREVQAREREANARMIEAEAIQKKTKSETDILSIEASAKLLRERKRLADEGISQEDIDALLPLKK